MTAILILSAIGIAAILIEVIVPGGLFGVVGLLSLVVAIVLTFIEYGPGIGTLFVIVLFVAGLFAVNRWMKYFHRVPLVNRLILNEESGKKPVETEDNRNPLIGETGVTLTDLVPSGHALIGDRRRDVMSESAAILRDTPVEVVAVRGPSLIVRALDPESPSDNV